MINSQAAFAPLEHDDIADFRATDRSGLNDWEPVPPPTSVEINRAILNRFAPPGYKLVKAWRYHAASGSLLHYTVRYDGPLTGTEPPGTKPPKKVLPFSFCRGPGGRSEWRQKAFPKPRPLYGLDRLAARPDAPVILVEGEKAADAAGKRFPEYVAITSSGGSDAARNADWSPLTGREIIIWRDADESGRTYETDAEASLIAAGAASVRIVHLPETLPEKWDLADELPPGITDADLAHLLTEAAPSAPNAGDAGWAAPLPIKSSLPPVETFNPQLLPGDLRGYVQDVAERQQSPAGFVAVAAVCALAAVLGNKVRIRPKQVDDWEVVPTQWGAIVGRPSAMKSPSLASALAPLYALQDEMRDQWQAARVEATVDEALAGLDSKAALRKAEKLVKDGNKEAARVLLQDAHAGNDDEPTPTPRLVVNDSSVEKLGELLNENPNGLLLVRDELAGLLARLESEECQSERAFYLEAFNGDGRFTYDRIGRGTIAIENCTLSMVGGIQPSRLAPIIRGAISGANNDGLVQRLQLAVWPDDIGEWNWVDRSPDAVARDKYDRAFRALHDLQLPHADGRPYAVLRFTPTAQALFQEWMTEVQTEARSARLSSAMESHILKLPRTIAGLALLFELVDDGRESVGEVATCRALDWADYLRSHANRIYAAGETMAEEGARLIVARRHQLPAQFTGRDIHRKGWAGLGDRDAVAAAIDVLIERHCCRPAPATPGPSGGRPSTDYVWNPRLKEGEHNNG